MAPAVVDASQVVDVDEPDAERLVFVADKEGGGIVWPTFEDWRLRATSFDGLASSLADAVLVHPLDPLTAAETVADVLRRAQAGDSGSDLAVQG